ncbi:ATP-binding cassette domain-containing protein [Halorubrum sp. BOL3-1]|uniref:ATP-binding cassette domain-containing protein n=1 Tax=Halorubrum sp. BOL3-1 TaxID=2497325 RepID=UPI0010051281|nr:ATP-binding cassette domain-containing protein [Halorubrum sp. BOL3-1]QAU14096.1 ATP-binding cassette domain-containing protein [Halorubrum sp. BOL3-1]
MRLRTEALGKRYSENTWGVRDVTLELGGGVHGLVGPNGAGKSTLMRMLTTVTVPTEGEIYWDGTPVTESPAAARRVLGYLPQDFDTYPSLTLQEYLEYVGALRGLDAETADARIEALLELVNLTDVRERRLDAFSGGMHQRAGIAQALLNDPEFLVVDEPTVGLDPEERVRMRNALADTADDRVVIFSTHVVADIEATADTVTVLDDGEVVTHGGTGDLIQSVEGHVYESRVSPATLETVRNVHQICNTVRRADGFDIRFVSEGSPTIDAEPVAASLEDAYLRTVEHAS